MRAGEIARLVAERTGGWMTEAHTLDVVTRIVAGPECVRELRDGDRLTAAGILIDNCASSANAAELSAFVTAEGELDTLLEWAERRLRGGPRDQLDVPLWPGLEALGPWLEARGFRPAYTLFQMERPGDPIGPAVLPPDIGWRPYSDDALEAYHALVSAAFRDVPGAFVQDQAALGARARTFAIPPQLLYRGDRLVGFVRVELGDDRTGELAMLGRHPDLRGARLGDVIVAHGLALLASRGAVRYRLEVAASNERALALYERFGFRTARRYTTWRRSL